MVSFSLFLLVLFFNGCAREHGTHPTGELLYRDYCASCHGLGGKGDGPLATSLRRPPTDLTTLRRRGGGRFDEAAVMAVIDGRRVVTEHGPREMPVWGVVFEEKSMLTQSDSFGSLIARFLSIIRERRACH